MDKMDFANPVYDDITGKAVWSMLYFGSYPQTEVKGYKLVPAITQAEYDINGDAYVRNLGNTWAGMPLPSAAGADVSGRDDGHAVKYVPYRIKKQ